MLRPQPFSTRRRLGALVALLALATASATYLEAALSVLSSSLIGEFGVTRSQLGLAFTVLSLIGGIGSPFVGRLVDGSTRLVLAGLFLTSTLGILLVACAPGYPWVLAALVIGGLAISAANPVTNKVVSAEITLARRGLVVGVKQAGPPMALLAAGLVLPPVAAVFGWRWALAATAVLPLLGLGATWALVPGRRRADPPPVIRASGLRSGRTTVRWLAGIGIVRAAGAASVIAFVPLYAQEALGLSPAVAGLLAATTGLTGVIGRIAWGASVSRFRDPSVPLALIPVFALLSTLVIWGAPASPWLIWVGVICGGLSMPAWLAVSWLALLVAVEPSDIGRTTGFIQAATSAGVAIGPLVMGVLVDATGSYGWGWGFVAALFAVTIALTSLWRRTFAPILEP